MISANDVVQIEITDEELEHCKANPVPGCTRESTGRLKALGNIAVMKALEISPEEFDMQLEAAIEMGSAYVCELRHAQLAGIAPTVSTIRGGDVVDKRVIVPANQLYRNPKLDTHFTVGVFLDCEKDASNELLHVNRAMVAGWIHTNQLKRWIKKGGTPPFSVQNASMAVAPCDVLAPMEALVNNVKWDQFCV